jgi:hypothetical protein
MSVSALPQAMAVSSLILTDKFLIQGHKSYQTLSLHEVENWRYASWFTERT